MVGESLSQAQLVLSHDPFMSDFVGTFVEDPRLFSIEGLARKKLLFWRG